MTMTTAETGQLGEDFAARYLEHQGYAILARNYRVRGGEVDIIAQKDGVLAFVEVKTRTSTIYAQPKEFVTAAKQRKLTLAALTYLAEHPSRLNLRMDIIEVLLHPGDFSLKQINHLKNAFEFVEL